MSLEGARPSSPVNPFITNLSVLTGDGLDLVESDAALKTHTRTGLSITKNGYLYINVSNETPNVDVFFDNVQATHVRGPLLEKTLIIRSG